MTFEETINYLKENIKYIEDVVPSFGATERALDIMIQKVKYAMENEGVEDLNAEEKSIIFQFLNMYLKGLILLNFEVPEEIANISEIFSLLVDNFSNIYSDEVFFDPTGLIIRTLVQVEHSLQAQIQLNMYLVGKLQDIMMYKDEPLDKILSQKYYDEYISFLNRRKNHDESYSLKEITKNN